MTDTTTPKELYALAEKRSEAGRCVAKDLQLVPSSKRWAKMPCDDSDGNCCLDCWETHLRRLAAAEEATPHD